MKILDRLKICWNVLVHDASVCKGFQFQFLPDIVLLVPEKRPALYWENDFKGLDPISDYAVEVEANDVMKISKI